MVILRVPCQLLILLIPASWVVTTPAFTRVNMTGVATEVTTTQRSSSSLEREPTSPRDMRADVELHSENSEHRLSAVNSENEQHALCKKVLLGAKAMHHFLWYNLEVNEKTLEEFVKTDGSQDPGESVGNWEKDMAKALHLNGFHGHEVDVKQALEFLSQSSDGLPSCDRSPSGNASVFAYKTIQKLYTAAVEYDFWYIRGNVNPIMPLAPSTDQCTDPSRSLGYFKISKVPLNCDHFTNTTLATYKELTCLVDRLLAVLDIEVKSNLDIVDINHPRRKELDSVQKKVFQMNLTVSDLNLISEKVKNSNNPCGVHARSTKNLIQLFYKSTEELYKVMDDNVGGSWILKVYKERNKRLENKRSQGRHLLDQK